MTINLTIKTADIERIIRFLWKLYDIIFKNLHEINSLDNATKK